MCVFVVLFTRRVKWDRAKSKCVGQSEHLNWGGATNAQLISSL